ncbi:MAG: DUF4397 domain-containing protein [Gemmatimonadaceae bacterium]
MRLTLLGALAFVLACGTEEAAGPLQPTGPTGRVRLVNLITDAMRARVNATLEGVPFAVDLQYTQSSPATLPAPSTAPYAAVLAGDRAFVLKRTADTTVTVATLSFNVADGQDRSVYAIGGANNSAITGFVTTDDNPAAAANQTRVRVVNLSPTAGALDVFLTAPNADLAAATPTLSNFAYQGASTYLLLTPGAYQFRAVRAGTAPAARAANVLINLASTTLAGRTGRTFVTADNSTGGTPLRVFVLSDR